MKPPLVAKVYFNYVKIPLVSRVGLNHVNIPLITSMIWDLPLCALYML